MSTLRAITMPKWGIEMEEGMITSWLIEEGTEIEKGVDLIDIETSKIVNTLEAPYSGKLARCIAKEGETLNVGSLLGVISEADVTADSIDEFISAFVPVDASFEQGEETQSSEAAPLTTAATKKTTTRRVSPPVRRLAEKLGVDLNSIESSSRITKAMVEAAAAGESAPDSGNTDSGNFSTTSMSNRRKTIAQRLLESKITIPHYYLTDTMAADALITWRKELASNDVNVSLNDLLAFVIAKTLVSQPQVNVTLDGNNIQHHNSANLCIAVATDDGLIAPVITAADQHTIESLSESIVDLVQRAQSGKLKATELTGGSFTLSNLGMYGIDGFQAIINPPQGAILAAGAIKEQVIAKDGQASVQHCVTVNLSCDHRIIDGADGAAFLQALKSNLKQPGNLK